MKQFLQETKKELKYVKWLKSRDVFVYTALVVVVSLITAYMLGAFDFVLELGLTKLLVK
jgi:preprotein translocase SecE subunit